MFNHQGPAVVCVMRNLTVRLFVHLEITPLMDVDKMVNYMQSLLIGAALKKYKSVLTECKKFVKELVGY